MEGMAEAQLRRREGWAASNYSISGRDYSDGLSADLEWHTEPAGKSLIEYAT